MRYLSQLKTFIKKSLQDFSYLFLYMFIHTYKKIENNDYYHYIMESIKIFNNFPKEGDIVSIIITDNKQDGSFPIILPDYELEGIIPYNSLTKKKKIKSINKVAPVNKVLPAIVESVDKIIVVSRVNIIKDSSEYSMWENNVTSVRKIKSFVSYMTQKEITVDNVLNNIIYPMELIWKDNINESEEVLNFFDFIKNNYNSLELDENLMRHLISFMDATDCVKKLEYRTKFGIIAKDSVTDMINMITPIVNKYNNLNITIENFPYHIIYSDSNNSKKEDHSNFLKELDSLENKCYMIKIL